MASIIKQAITDILGTLENIAGDVDYPAGANGKLFQFVAVYNNQFEDLLDGKTYSFATPSVLVEVPPFQPVTLGMNVKQADLVWRIYIADRQEDAEDGTMDQNLEVMGLRDAVIVALTGYKPTNCTGLFQVNDEQAAKHNNIYVYKLEFKCGFIDTKGSPLDPDSGQQYAGPYANAGALEVDTTITNPIPNANVN